MKKAIIMAFLTIFPRLLAAQQLDIKSLIGDSWYGVYMNGQKAGYAFNSTTVDASENVAVLDELHFRIVMAGIKQDMTMTSKRAYGKDGSLSYAETHVDDPSGKSEFVATVKGKDIVVRSMVGGQTTELKLPKPSESLEDYLRQLRLLGPEAKIGDSATYSFFEPLYQKSITGASIIEDIRDQVLDGVTTKVFKIKTTDDVSGLDTYSHVAQDGTVLENEVGGIMVVRLEREDLAKDVNYVNDVIISNAAQLDMPLKDPRGRTDLHLSLQGPLSTAHMFSDERQEIHLEPLTPTMMEAKFVGRKYVMDGFKAAPLPIMELEVQEWLKPSTFIQSDNAKLIEKAKEIVGDERNSLRASEKICHWVYENVKTTFSARLSNALEVLDHLEGDCTEHSILFIGLARAANIPAREVAGLIYVESPHPGFYFHQWAKVWVGKWIDVDPTFDQPLADVTHIKLAEGDLLSQAKLLPVIGQLKVAVDDGKHGE